MEILRKNLKERLEIESTVPEMKGTFDGHIRSHTAEERISQ